MIEKYELEKKRRAGVSGVIRSRDVASVDAAGAAMGGIGLLAFAFTVYKTVVRHPALEVLVPIKHNRVPTVHCSG